MRPLATSATHFADLSDLLVTLERHGINLSRCLSAEEYRQYQNPAFRLDSDEIGKISLYIYFQPELALNTKQLLVTRLLLSDHLLRSYQREDITYSIHELRRRGKLDEARAHQLHSHLQFALSIRLKPILKQLLQAADRRAYLERPPCKDILSYYHPDAITIVLRELIAESMRPDDRITTLLSLIIEYLATQPEPPSHLISREACAQAREAKFVFIPLVSVIIQYLAKYAPTGLSTEACFQEMQKDPRFDLPCPPFMRGTWLLEIIYQLRLLGLPLREGEIMVLGICCQKFVPAFQDAPSVFIIDPFPFGDVAKPAATRGIAEAPLPPKLGEISPTVVSRLGEAKAGEEAGIQKGKNPGESAEPEVLEQSLLGAGGP
ncbi:MAG TPA: hypothetical protein VJB02_06480 [Coxiellaceae bacterium]|nr:hypothetical protein [Coxiellaceae bacterium]